MTCQRGIAGDTIVIRSQRGVGDGDGFGRDHQVGIGDDRVAVVGLRRAGQTHHHVGSVGACVRARGHTRHADECRISSHHGAAGVAAGVGAAFVGVAGQTRCGRHRQGDRVERGGVGGRGAWRGVERCRHVVVVEVGVARVGGDGRHILVGCGHVRIVQSHGGRHHGLAIFQTRHGGCGGRDAGGAAVGARDRQTQRRLAHRPGAGRTAHDGVVAQSNATVVGQAVRPSVGGA